MFFARLLAAISVVGSASAFSILTPGGPNVWWVAGSENVMSWTCHDNPPAQTFQLLLNNTSPSILTSTIAILANLPNADCSQSITTQEVQLQPATGYTLIIADQLNANTIYATSQEFEVKAAGSQFPPASATPTDTGAASATGSGTGTSASTSSTATTGASTSNKSSAIGITASLAAVFSVAGAAFGML